MSDFQLTTPEFEGAKEKSALIMSLLQRDAQQIDPDEFDGAFFRVLASFENQGRSQGMQDAENPFVVLSTEISKLLFERSQACLTAEDVPEQFSTDVGRFRHMIKEAVHNPGMLPLAIRVGKQMLGQIDPIENPTFLAQLQNDMGTAYVDLQIQQRKKAVDTAIGYYEKALEYRTLGRNPSEHAETQYNLGNAWLQQPGVNKFRTQALNNAQNAFDVAQRVADVNDAQNLPLIWLGLGTAIALNPEQDFGVGIELLFKALNAFNAEEQPEAWALTHTRLGAANLLNPHGKNSAAIPHYASALDHYGQQKMIERHAAILIQLAIAYLREGDDTSLQTATEIIQGIQPILEAERSTQQLVQLQTAFGPGFSSYLTLPYRAGLAAKASKLELATLKSELRELAELNLLRIITEPENAALYGSRAFEAARAACPTCS